MNIKYILFIIIFLILFKLFNKNNNKNNNKNKIKEDFGELSMLDNYILANYKIEHSGFREIANLFRKMQYNGLTLPFDVHIMGKLNAIPKGIIICYNSMIAPYSWAICNGQNGTPDLRGRFIRMENSTNSFDNEFKKNTDTNNTHKDIFKNMSYTLKHNINNYGGTDTKNLINQDDVIEHTHTLDNAGEHQHTTGVIRWYGSYSYNSDPEHPYMANGGSGTGLPGQNEYNHTHTLNSIGGSEIINNQPPYYVLTFIMKL